MPIDPKYMTPNLRYGLFVKDHPGAPEPRFELVANDESGVPADFLVDECGDPVVGFVRCTLFYPDGSTAATAVREIPTSEARSGGKKAPFVRNAENWQKLCTMALGRALKRAGYPDTTTDLVAFLQYEKRNAEIALIRAGLPPVGVLEAGAPDPIAAAGVEQPDTDHPEQRPDGDVTDAEIVPDSPGKASEPSDPAPATVPSSDVSGTAPAIPDEYVSGSYPEPLAESVGLLSVDGKDRFMAWLVAQGITPAIAGERPAALRRAVNQARAFVAEETDAARLAVS